MISHLYLIIFLILDHIILLIFFSFTQYLISNPNNIISFYILIILSLLIIKFYNSLSTLFHFQLIIFVFRLIVFVFQLIISIFYMVIFVSEIVIFLAFEIVILLIFDIIIQKYIVLVYLDTVTIIML